MNTGKHSSGVSRNIKELDCARGGIPGNCNRHNKESNNESEKKEP